MPAADHPVCVTITTGRSGSTFLHNLFRHNHPGQAGILHESLHPGLAKPATYHRRFDDAALGDADVAAHLQDWDRLAQRGPVVDFGWVMGCLAPALVHRYGRRLRVLVLTAHPVSVAASFANRGHYTRNRNPAWALSPMHENVRHPQVAARWPGMEAFEKGLFRWLEITSLGLEFAQRHPEVPQLALRSDELFANLERSAEIASLVGFEPRAFDFSVPRNESTDNHVERRPVGEEWRRVFDFPEVLELATSLGFDMSPVTVEKLVAKYRLHGLWPRVRHATGYWTLREQLGSLRERAFGRTVT